MATKALVMKDDIMFKAFFSKKGNEIYLKEFLNANAKSQQYGKKSNILCE